MAAMGLPRSALPAASETSGRLEVAVALPVADSERERVAVEMVELRPPEGLMVAEAEAWLVMLATTLDLALAMTLLREEASEASEEESEAWTDEAADVAEEAADEAADEAEARTDETAEETAGASEPPSRGN